MAQKRSQQIITNFSHYNKANSGASNGKGLAYQLFKKYGYDGYRSECIAKESWNLPNSNQIKGGRSEKSIALSNLHEYIYNDASSNWGHRDALLNSKYNVIGVGGTLKNEMVYTTAELGKK
ncbi:hypothetical protein [Lentilactobacillus sp. Marseille-Q4993]|uniref:hypothetical protein n=1 Tax=Lentilactobacillus sp. Marseille-Q4993 TaxID=3039492 RepID=UPI0024BC422E|nr:hypothetical protein [Lentilactobacillus sp. Marseille-Q4993]